MPARNHHESAAADLVDAAIFFVAVHDDAFVAVHDDAVVAVLLNGAEPGGTVDRPGPFVVCDRHEEHHDDPAAGEG
jgi:hypothetical protein